MRFFAPVLLTLALVSCKKDRRTLDSAVQPQNDLRASGNVQVLPVALYTERYDTIQVFNSDLKFLGTNNDPVFGRTEVGLYLTARYSVAAIDFTTQVSVDSAVFVLAADPGRFAGDRAAKLTYSVFPLDSVLSNKRVYTSRVSNLHSAGPLSTFPERAFSDTSRTIRIPMDLAYASAMLNDPLLSVTSGGAFYAKYKGFYIKGSPAPGSEGVILSCDMDDAASGLFFYYKVSTETVQRTMRFVFGGDNAVRFNTVHHDRSSAHASLQSQIGGDTSASQSVFMQGLGGTRIHVAIPLAPETSDSFNVAVSRAELVLNVDQNYVSEKYKVPPFLSLLPVGVNGKDTIIQDQLNSTDNGRYGGIYKDGKYVFNIARHAQAIVNGDKMNRGFYLVVSNPDRAGTVFRDEHFERVVLGGAAHAALKPRFTLSYTRVSVN